MTVETTETTVKKTRVRRRSLPIQMEQALRDAAAASTADIATKKLVQTRLTILSKMMARDRAAKLKRTLEQLAVVTAEAESLRCQHERDTAEIERLRDACRIDTSVTFDDVVARLGGTNGKSQR